MAATQVFRKLEEAGCRELNAVAFVDAQIRMAPRAPFGCAMPQMTDAEELPRAPGLCARAQPPRSWHSSRSS